MLLLIAALVVGAGVLAHQALQPVDVSAPVPAHVLDKSKRGTGPGTAAGPDAKTQPVTVSNRLVGHTTSMTAADMGNNSLFIPALGV